MSPQGQRPEDLGEDLPEPSRKPSPEDKHEHAGKRKHEDKDKSKDDASKNDGTANHKPGRM